MIRVNPSVFGQLQRLIASLQQADSSLEDRETPHERIRDYQKNEWVVNFDSEGSILSGGWQELSDRWAEQRGSYHPILKISGDMRSNVIDQIERADIGTDATNWNFVNEPPNYPVTHHLAVPSAFNNPARPIWVVNGTHEARWGEIMEEYVDEVIARFF